MKMTAVIFDMDGVIFDSEQELIDCWIEIAGKYGIPDVVPSCEECIGLTEEESARVFRRIYGQDLPYEKIRGEVNDLYIRHCNEGKLKIKPGARELLDYCLENKIPAALASSTPIALVKMLLENACLLRYFVDCIGGNMVEHGKPAPDIFFAAAEVLWGKEYGKHLAETLIIEDSYKGIDAACAAGIPVVMVPDLLPPTKECGEKTLAILPDLHAVRELIESWKREET